MKREIKSIAATCEAIEMDGFANEPTKWLFQQMHAHKLEYLLAHADDGVIWGRLNDEELIISHDVAPEHSPPLRAETLQTVRLFAVTGELLVWRDEVGAWVGRFITEMISGATAEWSEAYEEKQVLLGTYAKPLERGFSLLSEGSQGLFHVVPIHLSGQIDEERRPLHLVVRHYLKADNYGFVRVDASRLLGLHLEPKESNI